MAKFVIECPNCGKYAEARTGFFATRKIHCTCGYLIRVNVDKLSSRECPHCGNQVVFDQSKGEKAKCPVCREPINTMAEQSKTVEISCAQCGVRLMVNKAAGTYTCPVCDCENDVAERITSEEIKKDGLASIIKYEGDGDTLVWKHPIEDFNYGSQLIVHESQEAVFFRNGQALDLFGSGSYTLETQQLPMLEKLYKLPTDTEGTFHSEVYYINLSTVMGVKWGTDSKVRMFDPASGLHIEIGASGEFNIHVDNSRKLLLKLIGTTGGLNKDQLLGMGDGKGYFRAMIMTQVKSYLAQTIKNCNINILEIDEHLAELSNDLREKLNTYLEDYGLKISEFFVSRVITPDDDPNFRKMKEQYAAQYLLVREEQIRKSEAEAARARKEVEAATNAKLKIIGAQGEAEALKLKAQAEADAYRMQAEAEAMEMKMKGYTYQQETARQVGLEAMQNGLTGGGNAGIGALGDLAGLGIGLGAMGSVIGMTKDAISSTVGTASQMGNITAANIAGEDTNGANVPNNSAAGTVQGAGIPDTWDCECGQKGIASKFCPNCGNKKPEKPIGWNCTSCGMQNITTNFCPNCGSKRPEEPSVWDCECGQKNISTKFCPECGKKRG